ncbi:dual-specificity RNA methyltransferase RlmN isoform X1 [Cucumis melo var. makuwa]|uniref:Dual-specificity RNA methyltransferase RlmN isoform X1 n=1 Tax=Cucumis melo var. makuwa TaxID=1194695 RepID=A0A5A7V983_CUCMM|nr:dual-specificity RNA methyltransferase RlmN isoform X1 [Cucumis melo var. makuwa]
MIKLGFQPWREPHIEFFFQYGVDQSQDQGCAAAVTSQKASTLEKKAATAHGCMAPTRFVVRGSAAEQKGYVVGQRRKTGVGLVKRWSELAVTRGQSHLAVRHMEGSAWILQILFNLEDGLIIETVVIPCDRGRTTVCVSSQVGCAMNCQFCYTGRMGLKRHLTAAEIVEQAVFARRLLTSEVGLITNVVFMGMGEPLHNIDNVIKAANIMVHEQGLHFSPRKVTVSTSGLVPQLKRFLNECNCALAVSLNATTDEVRNWIMPINRKYKLGLLLQTLREELRCKHKYKVLFEYVMLAGVNDSIEDAKRIVDLVQGIPCKINLISFNPHCGSQFRPTCKEKMIGFRNVLAESGLTVFLRLSRGDDQMAACGQLGKPGIVQAPLLRVPDRFQMAMELCP